MRALLISTYDLGRQPFGLASPAAWLRSAGVEVSCADLAKERLPEDAVRSADAIAFFLPMHTATRLALPVIDRVRAINPAARLIAYGLYAPMNASMLRERGVTHIAGGEFEADLVEMVTSGRQVARQDIPRLAFVVPDRSRLLPLARYARLLVGGEQRTAGYTEASRGCKHRCRHCPIVPVYDGRFRIVPIDIVLADVRAQVEAGARHITFGDPDFLNGVRHAADLVRQFGASFPGVSYDVTIKVEHLLKHAAMLPLLQATGCAFVTTAVESFDDRVLERLAKGHTREDFERAVVLCRDAGLTLAPTFVAFTPWTTTAGYLALLRGIEALGLVEHVAPIQLAIRLLIPEGSRLLELDDVRALAPRFDAGSLTYRWSHPDPEVDALQNTVSALVGVRSAAPRGDVFAHIWDLAHAHAGVPPPRRETPRVSRAAIPYLNEPWFC
jgi:radical SAM superfamily enzyme YgiQ (UPF0313 family)